MRSTGAIILAAGASRRMGRPKALLPWADSTCVGFLATVFMQTKLSPILIIIPDGELGTMIQAALPDTVKTLCNRAPEKGPIFSLQLGAKELLSKGVKSAIINPVDQPFVSIKLCQKLLTKMQQEKQNIVASYQGKWGHPYALFDLQTVLSLQEHETARDLLEKSQTNLLETSPEVLWNVNTPEMYQKAQTAYQEKETSDG